MALTGMIERLWHGTTATKHTGTYWYNIEAATNISFASEDTADVWDLHSALSMKVFEKALSNT